MNTPGQVVVEREIQVEAPPEDVFAHFTDSSKVVRWMGKVATLEPRVGGRFRLEYNDRDVASGEFLIVERPRRIVFSWGWEHPDSTPRPGASVVEVTLEPIETGTRVRLVHRQLTSDEAVSHAVGWDQFLPALAALVRSTR